MIPAPPVLTPKPLPNPAKGQTEQEFNANINSDLDWRVTNTGELNNFITWLIAVRDSFLLDVSGQAAEAAAEVAAANQALAVGGDYTIPSAEFPTIGSFISYAEDRAALGVIRLLVSGQISEPDDLVIRHPFNVTNFRIEGDDFTEVNINSIGTVTGSAKNWLVPLNVDSAADIDAGDWVRISPLNIVGTGRPKEITGCWKVVNVTGNVVTIKHNHYANTFPAMTVSGQMRKYNSVLSFPEGARGVVVESGCTIKNLHWHQEWDPVTDVASDHPDDGFQVGSAQDTTTTGLTQSERVRGASAQVINCSCSNFPGNGGQTFSSSVVAVGFMACSNGHRGQQSAEQAYFYNYAGVSAANAQSNFEAERSGTFTIPNGAAYGGGAQNLYALSNATIQDTNCYLGNSPTNCIDAKKGAFIDKTNGEVFNDGIHGVICNNARVELTGFETVGGNIGWSCTNAGVIDGSGAIEPTATTPYSNEFDQAAIIITADGVMAPTAATTELVSSGGTTARSIITSSGDISYQFDAGSGYQTVATLKAGGDWLTSVTANIGRISDPYAFVYAQNLNLSNLPTSSTGLRSGDTWNDGGTVKIV